MNNDYASFYSDAQRYDLVMGAYASGDQLNFYRRQVARYGEPVLELACGSGRFTIPLAQEGVNITGIDISEEMLNLAKSKASSGWFALKGRTRKQTRRVARTGNAIVLYKSSKITGWRTEQITSSNIGVSYE